jgi:hypothetical protein
MVDGNMIIFGVSLPAEQHIKKQYYSSAASFKVLHKFIVTIQSAREQSLQIIPKNNVNKKHFPPISDRC